MTDQQWKNRISNVVDNQRLGVSGEIRAKTGKNVWAVYRRLHGSGGNAARLNRLRKNAVDVRSCYLSC